MNNYKTENANLIDFTNCHKSTIQYGGSEKKIGVIYNDIYYMLKFPKIINGRKIYNHISEYLASHIIELAGLEVHKTVLGAYQGEEVVAVQDFIAGTNYSLVEFAATGDSSYDTEREDHNIYTYNDIIYLIKKHVKIEDSAIVAKRFWEMFIMDALLANFDRHGYNWGFLKNEKEYFLAPIYDNGSSLFPRLQDDELAFILDSKKELDKRTYQFPTSQIKINNKKSSYFEVIQSRQYMDCTNMAKQIFSHFDFKQMEQLIDGIPIISRQRKVFYKAMIQYRYEHIFSNIVN